MSDEQRTRRYETMIVLRTDLQEAGVKEQIERIRKLLEAQGATVGGIHEWGLRELAYAIQKERRGCSLAHALLCKLCSLSDDEIVNRRKRLLIFLASGFIWLCLLQQFDRLSDLLLQLLVISLDCSQLSDYLICEHL